MDRRQFNTALGVFGVANAQSSVHVETFYLLRNGWMPNNDRLPVLIYRRAFNPSSSLAEKMEQLFQQNQWPPQWRNGVYDFHHYHSTAHKVLGFAGGTAGIAGIVFGGEGGQQLQVEAGDVAVLPTGSGHCRISASSDFLVIGAYPEAQHWDICRSAPDAAAIAGMAKLPFPESDPVTGSIGRLITAWHDSHV